MRLLATLLMVGAAMTPISLLAQEPDAEGLLTIDHRIPVRSTVPILQGQTAQIYVRERVRAGTSARGAFPAGRVVLFVHGAGTPAEVAFDVPHPGYSWMAFLAAAGYDVFSVDMTGYGRSNRPAPMNDPCNLPEAQQAALIPALIGAPCKPNYAFEITTAASDWNDLGAAVDYIRELRSVDRVSLIAWSLGGVRAGGYASRNPQKIEKLIFLAPVYSPNASDDPPTLPDAGTAFGTQDRDAFIANWDRQVGCENQYEPAVRDAVWKAMLESDEVGATWGTGVRRAPSTTTWGWNKAAAARIQVPTMLVSGVHDRQVSPARVRPLLDDLGSTSKVFIDLGCSSHNAMWEKNHTLLYQASLEWLNSGTFQGAKTGAFQLGY
jgi:pimeloyl-ACP methyl ester carboxylesterase